MPAEKIFRSPSPIDYDRWLRQGIETFVPHFEKQFTELYGDCPSSMRDIITAYDASQKLFPKQPYAQLALSYLQMATMRHAHAVNSTKTTLEEYARSINNFLHYRQKQERQAHVARFISDPMLKILFPALAGITREEGQIALRTVNVTWHREK